MVHVSALATHVLHLLFSSFEDDAKILYQRGPLLNALATGQTWEYDSPETKE